MLRNTNNADRSQNQATEPVHKRAAAKVGMTVHYFDVHQPEDIVVALNAVAAGGIKAMLYMGDRSCVPAQHGVPARPSIGIDRHHSDLAEAGGLAHYSPDGRGFYDRTADFVARILKGARPSDLPVEEPTSFELVINLKTAKAIGLTIPQPVQLRADRVIE